MTMGAPAKATATQADLVDRQSNTDGTRWVCARRRLAAAHSTAASESQKHFAQTLANGWPKGLASVEHRWIMGSAYG
jgi:hypothetical protein